MNIALTAIILFILLLPGAIAIRAFFSSLSGGKGSSKYIPFNDLILKGLIISIAIHCCSLCTLHLLGYEVKMMILYNIVIGDKLLISDHQLYRYVLQFCSYSITIFTLTWLVSKKIRSWVLNNNWDINHFGLTTNYWFHIFSARFLEENDVDGTRENTDLIWLDVLTTSGMIYSGALHDFNYSATKDDLENLILTNTYKSKFKTNETEGDAQSLKTITPVALDGDIFIIPFEKIVNINVYYLKINTDNFPLIEGENQE